MIWMFHVDRPVAGMSNPPRRKMDFPLFSSAYEGICRQNAHNKSVACQFVLTSVSAGGFRGPPFDTYIQYSGFALTNVANLHGIIAKNLLPDEAALGRPRRIAVGIEKSVFHPLEVPHSIEDCFNQLLATAQAIHDPFEQSFFAMVTTGSAPEE
jgi:hypothetical protein